MSEPVLLVGFGNPWRGDDALGPRFVEEAQKRFSDAADCLLIEAEATTLLDRAEKYQTVILVDAVEGELPPGELVLLDLLSESLPKKLRGVSSHTLDVLEVASLMKTLGRAPACLLLFGAQGKQYAPGTGLSIEVEHALTAILEEVRRLLASE